MIEYKENALKWCKVPFDIKTQREVKSLFDQPDQLEDAFHKNLKFGTGGMRGIMGVGTNRINKYTLGKATQGLSIYLKSKFSNNKIKAVIAYDCRHNNDIFSEIVSNILLANGIKVYLFSSLRTTPELSFSVKYLKANCGIVLTASHNPPEYNGFKVYWKDGGQIVPPIDYEIMNKIDLIDYNEILFDAGKKKPIIIDKKLDHAFIKTSIKLALQDDLKSKNTKIVFTSLHGTSIVSIPDVLKKAGHNFVVTINEQSKPDGSFPTVKSPNPEEPEALKMAIDKALEIDADIVIGTDPDSDRIGIAIKNKKNQFILLNGNQTMLIMAHFILNKRKEDGLLSSKDFIASTIVSSPVIKKVANNFGVECILTLTGFKWISKEIEERKNQNFIFGGEESFGYLIGDEIRDKDAVTSALLICEIAAILKIKGKTLYDFMIECYKMYTPHKERLVSHKIEGVSGEKQIKKMMFSFRHNPPKKINNQQIISIDDFLNSTNTNFLTNKINNINLPKTNLIIYTLKDNSRIAIRPSGTEPKIKFYFSVNKNVFNNNDWRLTEIELDKKIDSIILDLNL